MASIEIDLSEFNFSDLFNEVLDQIEADEVLRKKYYIKLFERLANRGCEEQSKNLFKLLTNTSIMESYAINYFVENLSDITEEDLINIVESKKR